MRTIQLKVPTIKCEGGVETIRTALSKHAGLQGRSWSLLIPTS